MGFLEKLKNTFFEEEYVEVEEKPKVKKEPKKEVKKEPKKVVIHRVEEESPEVVREVPAKKEEVKTVRREEKTEEKRTAVVREVEPVDIRPQPVKKETSFGYFDDEDFLDFSEEVYEKPVVSPKRQESVKNVNVEKAKLYDNPSYGAGKVSSGDGSKPYSKETKTGFKPTPIISPIYGILDTNYKKDEIIDKKEIKPSSSYVSRKNADLDSVREKAFGSLAGDFGLTVPGDAIKDEELAFGGDDSLEVDDNLLYDMTDTCKTPSVDKVTLQDAEEYFQDLGLEYNIDYKDAKLERATGRRVSKTPKIDDIDEEEEVAADVSSHEEVEVATEDSSLEDNLFDLIDSMYEEKE